ncbi:MAG: class I SAM-dependent methyltransferase [Desulfovibrionaceae bacterium]|nr:class I SAM-dependent methyltransferase [Desulfovibrionaceae bacterium]
MNLRYSCAALEAYFTKQRLRWDQFYPSERFILEGLAARPGGFGSLLDVGCALGGLGRALCEFSAPAHYTGVDIHSGMIETARREAGLSCPAAFVHGDILELEFPGGFDTVVSLSCADWNVRTLDIIDACWRCVRPGGAMALSLRLTPGQGVNDIAISRQPIGPGGEGPDRETANYVVFNVHEALAALSGLNPAPGRLEIYGYWGKPSPTAVTPYEKLVFCTVRLDKPRADQPEGPGEAVLRLPVDLFQGKFPLQPLSHPRETSV